MAAAAVVSPSDVFDVDFLSWTLGTSLAAGGPTTCAAFAAPPQQVERPLDRPENLRALIQKVRGDLDRHRRNGDTKSELGSLLGLSELQAMSEQHAASLQSAELALSMSRALGEREDEGLALHQITQAQLAKEVPDLEVVLRSAQEAAQIFRDLGDSTAVAAALMSIVRAKEMQNKPDEAMEVADETLAGFRKEGDEEGEAMALVTLAKAHVSNGQLDAAVTLVQEALGLYKKLGKRAEETGALMLSVSQAYISKEDSAQALLWGKRALDVFIAGEDRYGEGSALHVLANSYLSKEKLDDAALNEAEAAASESRDIFEELGQREPQAAALQTLTLVRHLQDRHAEAREASAAAADLCRKSDNRRGEAAAHLQSADCSLASEDYAEAAHAALRALEVFREMRDKPGQAGALLFVSRAHLTRDQWAAVEAAEQAAALWRGTDDRKQEGDAQLALAEAHLARRALAMQGRRVYMREHTLGAVRAIEAAYTAFNASDDEDGVETAMAMALGFAEAAGLAELAKGEDKDRFFKELATSEIQEVLSKAAHSAMEEEDLQSYPRRDHSAGFYYTMVWEPHMPEKASAQSRQLRARLLASAPRSHSIPLYHGMQALTDERSAASKDMHGSLCVHFVSHAHQSYAYGTTMMEVLHTISAMVSARASKMAFVQLGEGKGDGHRITTAARQVAIGPTTLAMIRSARIEAPNLSWSFVSGDVASWMVNRSAMLESIFAQHELRDNEELSFTNGDCYVPSLLPRPVFADLPEDPYPVGPSQRIKPF